MSRYNTIIKNDLSNGEGVCVSLFVQGCPHHCKGCFNPETWDFDGGELYTGNTKWEIVEAIGANNIQRNFCILGGEPLDERNLQMIKEIVCSVRVVYPTIKIFLWTGFLFDNLPILDEDYAMILDKIDVIIDGQYVEELKDLNLKWRGSSNQKIWIKKDGLWGEDDGENYG